MTRWDYVQFAWGDMCLRILFAVLALSESHHPMCSLSPGRKENSCFRSDRRMTWKHLHWAFRRRPRFLPPSHTPILFSASRSGSGTLNPAISRILHTIRRSASSQCDAARAQLDAVKIRIFSRWPGGMALCCGRDPSPDKLSAGTGGAGSTTQRDASERSRETTDVLKLPLV